MPPERTPDHITTFRLPDGERLTGALQAALQSPPRDLVLDFSAVSYVASVDLGMLLKLRQQLHTLDRRLRLFGLRPKVRELFRITSLDLVLDLYDTEHQAMESLSGSGAQELSRGRRGQSHGDRGST
jgi:anti-anti-sigma factor